MRHAQSIVAHLRELGDENECLDMLWFRPTAVLDLIQTPSPGGPRTLEAGGMHAVGARGEVWAA